MIVKVSVVDRLQVRKPLSGVEEPGMRRARCRCLVVAMPLHGSLGITAAVYSLHIRNIGSPLGVWLCWVLSGFWHCDDGIQSRCDIIAFPPTPLTRFTPPPIPHVVPPSRSANLLRCLMPSRKSLAVQSHGSMKVWYLQNRATTG